MDSLYLPHYICSVRNLLIFFGSLSDRKAFSFPMAVARMKKKNDNCKNKFLCKSFAQVNHNISNFLLKSLLGLAL